MATWLNLYAARKLSDGEVHLAVTRFNWLHRLRDKYSINVFKRCSFCGILVEGYLIDETYESLSLSLCAGNACNQMAAMVVVSARMAGEVLKDPAKIMCARCEREYILPKDVLVVARVNISDTVENREGVVCNDLHT